MHVLGKVLAVLVFFGAATAIWATSKTLAIRSQWMSKVEKARDDYKGTVAPLATARKRVADLQHERNVARFNWYPYFNQNIVVQPNVVQTNPANRNTWKFGIAVQGLGPVSGIKVGEVIHAFGPVDQSKSLYLGSFRVTQVIPTPPTITAEPTWAIRAADKADDPEFPGQTRWESPTTYGWGNGWRIRTALPNAEPTNLQHYSQMLVKKDEQFVAMTSYRTATERQKSVADVQLKYRQDELHGDVNLEARDLPRHRIDGLVKAIGVADDDRNVTLGEVNDLRHQLKSVYDRMESLQDLNRKIAEDLPGAADVDATTAAN